MTRAQVAWIVLTGWLAVIGLGCLMVGSEAARSAAGALVGCAVLGYVALLAMIVADRRIE